MINSSPRQCRMYGSMDWVIGWDNDLSPVRTKALSKPMMPSHQPYHMEQTSLEINIETNQFPLMKFHLS